jgi:hypothetical protein
MTAKELVVGSALLLGATFAAAIGTSSATLAQGYYGYRYADPAYRGLYNYYGFGPLSRPNIERGGPGPRVQGGSGQGIGAVR